MSPTEHDLRAALRDGEGDGLDAARIVAAGERARVRRRSRMVNTVASAAVVAGLATGGAVLIGHQDTEHAGSSSNRYGALQQRKEATTGHDAASSAGGAGPAAGGALGANSAAAPAASGPVCPATATAPVAPPALTAGPLFSAPVATVLVCSYSQQAGGTSVRLTGADAQTVVHSLDTTSAVKPAGMCPLYRLADERILQFVASTADGQPAGVVTTTLGRPPCATVITNGKTARYGWRPPALLLARLGTASASPSR